jgi:Na+-transporting NADH:ubiquinone oxidoreductase subunit A
MANSIKIRKGTDIRLAGEAEKTLETLKRARVFAVRPPDFHGVIPRMMVKEGDRVLAGDALFHDKYNEAIKFSSPVSGEVSEVVRGEKRRILAVLIKADAANEYRSFSHQNAASTKKEELIKILLEAGVWPFLRQRPYAVVANPTLSPKAIFVSGFDSSPLAPDPDFVLNGEIENFQEGINALNILAAGKPVHLSYKKGSSALTGIQKATLHEVSGPHPAGNVGVQIHHIDPINKGEVVWYVDPQDVANIGRFLKTGKVDFTRVVALTGSEVKAPKYYRTTVGAQLSDMLSGQLSEGNVRVINGNVLTGETSSADGYLGYFSHQVTCIPEGTEPQFLLTTGWLGLGFDKYSISRSFPTWLMPKSKKFKLNTNSNGEERAFVVTGQYEEVFPFDIYPVQLLKSIIVNDLDAMEKLGIYEVAPEDFALCEYVCTSKIDAQRIIREGLDTARIEFS